MLTSAGIGNHAVRPKNGRLFPLILIPDHSVLMTFRVCLRELCCLFGIFYCLSLNHLVRVFYLFMFS